LFNPTSVRALRLLNFYDSIANADPLLGNDRELSVGFLRRHEVEFPIVTESYE
jgi:hypothetical protein